MLIQKESCRGSKAGDNVGSPRKRREAKFTIFSVSPGLFGRGLQVIQEGKRTAFQHRFSFWAETIEEMERRRQGPWGAESAREASMPAETGGCPCTGIARLARKDRFLAFRRLFSILTLSIVRPGNEKCAC